MRLIPPTLTLFPPQSHVLLALALSLLLAVPLAAQETRPSILNGVGIDQKLNEQVPADLVFRDESGRDVRLGDYFTSGRPIILTLVYYKCPMLCTMVLNELTRSLNGLKQSVGEQFDVVTISFDPSETPDLAAAKKRQYLKEYRRPHAGEGWHFLTGTQDSIRRLTDAVGFRYTWDGKYKQYAHASGIMVLTPQGRLSRYFYGVDYAPTDLRFAMIDATGGKIASPAEQVLMYCFHYDPSTGKYGLFISRLLKVGGAVTILVIGAFVSLSLLRERRREAMATAGAGTSGGAAPWRGGQ